MELFGVLLGAALTLMCYSFVYRDNLFFKLAEHMLVGVTIGYTLAVGLKTLRDSLIIPFIGGELLLIIPLITGLLLFTRLTPKYAHLSRWGIAIMAGVGSGVAVRTSVGIMIIPQILLASKPLSAADPVKSLNQLIILLGLISVLVFFVFTFLGRKSVSTVGRLGRYFLMTTFGVVIAGDLIGNMSFIQDRTKILLETPSVYLTLFALLLVVIDFVRRRRQPSVNNTV